jgi:2-keto-4-pentenoate hydratase/2-oxohepta-3-ene-1,7-dioic acid hydratase in catechol pathway
MQTYVRFRGEQKAIFGRLESGVVHELVSNPLDSHSETGRTFGLDEIELLLPLDPDRTSKVVGVATNYSTADPQPLMPHPRWFTKQVTALSIPDNPIELPDGALNLNHEGELVVVIGTTGREIPLEEASEHIFGVTVGNDWSENTWYLEQAGDDEPSRLISKSVDGWAAIYPAIFSGVDCSDLGIDVTVNGQQVAHGRTSQMVNSVDYLIHYLSHFATLLPGDVIFTGTVAPPVLPGCSRKVTDGDLVEVVVEGLGGLQNVVRSARRPARR